VFAASGGLTLKIGTPFGYFRTLAQQQELLDSGKSKTLKSKHLEGLAVDLILFEGPTPIYSGILYRALGEYWESQGGRWGGRFGVDP